MSTNNEQSFTIDAGDLGSFTVQAAGPSVTREQALDAIREALGGWDRCAFAVVCSEDGQEETELFVVAAEVS